ncbi:MAG: cyclomaltodextrinase N-terminal domain-containing protein [Chitinophagaceae bacterium]|nr:cyclomaltodextrinase N-terminal domain-containing protein [Chitinophagaceae bacterium]
MKNIFFALLLFVQGDLYTQTIYPTHWFTGMKNPNLQLIIHRDRVAQESMTMLPYAGVKLVRQTKVENPNYLFVDLHISPAAKPGKLRFRIDNLQSPEAVSYKTFEYELKARSKYNGKTRVQGVTSEDMIYLLMPDRFCNGDPSNDYFDDMRDKGHDRNNPFDRHGGDLKGVQDKLDYIQDLGATTIWMTPVVENDMSRTMEGGSSRSTYHGYAFTDQYNRDKRLGGNEAYRKLVETAHNKGLKIIQDAVYNHIGNDHWSVRDMPMKDWLNQWPAFTNTSYKDQPMVDPYGSTMDKKVTVDGWFTPFLVDLNQRNPYVSTFLIQYAVWATEEFGIDGWRVDTYFYSDPIFLNKVNEALYREFPSVTVFGEVWVQSVINSAYFCENNISLSFKHNCQGVTDFPVYFASLDLLNQPFGWNEGANRFYQTLAQDVVYKNPMRNCLFLDNHDMNRFYSMVGEDFLKYQMGINLLLTQRGIPQLYYGTEVLMKNYKDPSDAEVRKDFPGGWPGDTQNKFLASGRTEQENKAYNYIKTLAHFRKNSSAITTGKLMQFVPKDGLYTYFRYDNRQTVMVISNTSSSPQKPDWSFYKERLAGFTMMKNVITGEIRGVHGFEIKPKESFVFELVK